MKLYIMPGACSLASHASLIWAGLPYDIAVLSHANTGVDAFRRINPKAILVSNALSRSVTSS